MAWTSAILGCAMPPEASGFCSGSEWIDKDTPATACTTNSTHDQLSHTLVFSDEFDYAGRTFADGEDTKWTAIHLAPHSNEQVNFYNETLASTQNGRLEILSISEDATYDAGNQTTLTRHLQTAMLQSWNKYCFSEGIAEIHAQMPGRYDLPGLWPVFCNDRSWPKPTVVAEALVVAETVSVPDGRGERGLSECPSCVDDIRAGVLADG